MMKTTFAIVTMAISSFLITSSSGANEPWKPKNGGNPIIRDHRGLKADLRFTNVLTDNTKVHVGYENVGKGTARAAKVRVTQYKKVNGKEQFWAFYIADMPALAPGKRHLVTLTFPSGVANSRLVAELDYTNVVQETNEGNNRFVRTVN